MKILVIEDFPVNLESARLTLADYDLTVCADVREAYNLLHEAEEWQAVLTDLYLPRGSFRGEMSSAGKAKENLPAGLIFAIKAANRGIRSVIVTDSNHHYDWLCALLDLVGNPNYVDDSQRIISYVEARSAHFRGSWDERNQALSTDGCEWVKVDGIIIKDWLKAMKWSGLFPEIGVDDNRPR